MRKLKSGLPTYEVGVLTCRPRDGLLNHMTIFMHFYQNKKMHISRNSSHFIHIINKNNYKNIVSFKFAWAGLSRPVYKQSLKCHWNKYATKDLMKNYRKGFAIDSDIF